mgnify:CR=1 FL=1
MDSKIFLFRYITQMVSTIRCKVNVNPIGHASNTARRLRAIVHFYQPRSDRKPFRGEDVNQIA